MFKKIIEFIKSLFIKAEVSDEQVDRFIKQYSPKSEKTYTLKEKPRRIPVKVEIESKKTLSEKLEKVELPVYAQGRVLPPKAKRTYIKTAASGRGKAFKSEGIKTRIAERKKGQWETPSSNIDPATAVVAAVVLSDDNPPVKSHTVDSGYCSHNSNSHSSHSSYDSHSSYSSYDSGSSDSGSSSSSCD